MSVFDFLLPRRVRELKRKVAEEKAEAERRERERRYSRGSYRTLSERSEHRRREEATPIDYGPHHSGIGFDSLGTSSHYSPPCDSGSSFDAGSGCSDGGGGGGD